MDDGGSPVIGLIVFLVLVAVSGGLYGFLTALEEVTESQVQKRAEEGSRHAAWLLLVMDDPYKTRHAIQIMVTFVSGIFGIYQIRMLGNFLVRSLSQEGADPGIRSLCFVLATVAGIFFFAVVGIIAPQKIAARKPEQWLFALGGILHGMALYTGNLELFASRINSKASFSCVLPSMAATCLRWVIISLASLSSKAKIL